MTFSPGDRARHRLREEVGVVVGTSNYNGGVRYRVSFPSGEWEVSPADLLAVVAGPFEVLRRPPATVYPYDGWLRREALRLQDAYRNDPSSALSNSRIEPQHHQISVALRALAKPQPRLIVADEVGLGKTIEAGLILKELRARGVLERVLIITPATLLTQWQRELRTKFNENFVIYDGATLRDLRQRNADENPWDWGETANVLCSLAFTRGERERPLVASARWDLVIVDEAHHARRNWNDGKQEPNLGYRMLEEMRDRVGGLLLLTATPMQLHGSELYAMVELVEPGLFDGYADFEASRDEIAAINKHVAWLRTGSGTPSLEKELDAVMEAWRAPDELKRLDRASAVDRDLVCRWLEQQHRLSHALVRNRKAYVGGFTKREAHRVPVIPTDAELQLELDVTLYLRRIYARSPAFGLVLATFQKLIASSSRAVGGALQRRADRLLHDEAEAQTEELAAISDDPEIVEELQRAFDIRSHDVTEEAAELEELAVRARAISDAKLDALDGELMALFNEQPDQKVLIFSQYLDTIEMVRERLADRFRVATFHGGMDLRHKDLAYDHFRDPVGAQVLVSSEAGGEGRNFQFCHILFNYDLPWNPMRIEQRIGRLDRVGQKRNVLIYNFGVSGTLDERILDVLDHRIKVFSESVGALEPILGDVERRLERICVLDARRANREFDRYEIDIEERVRLAREKEEHMRDFVLDDRSFRRDEVERLLGHEPMATADDLRRFVFAVFARYPKAKVDDLGDGIVRLELPGRLRQIDRRLKDSYEGTFDYRVALQNESLDFFAFGHPVVDAAIVEVAAEGAVPPVAVLEGDETTLIVVIDYIARFTGVRDRDELFSVCLPAGDARTFVQAVCPSDPNSEVVVPSFTDDEARIYEEVGRFSADKERQRRFERFQTANDAAYGAERERLVKRFTFQRRHFDHRIAQRDQTIARLERSGTEQERRVIPALRGQIQSDRRALERLDEERESALGDLELRREPTEALMPVGVTILMPRTSARMATDDQ